MPDSAQMSAMMGRALRRLQPAQFVLDHRAELALTPEQIPYLESLVVAEADSTRVRTERRLTDAMATTRNPLVSRSRGATAWTGDIDEAAIRELTMKQAEQSAAIQIDLARDRHAVGAVLTQSQVSMLTRIESEELMTILPPRVDGAIRSPTPSPGGLYFAFQVEKQVAEQPGTSGPKYPDALRANRTIGEVLAQFVVDSTGHCENGSFKLLESTHPLFTQAVRDALPQMRFVPAEAGGAKVRQLVQQLFSFSPTMK
jgi:TonB family protein